jgi:RNA polymerase sigma-70 factor (ECF subfamily)
MTAIRGIYSRGAEIFEPGNKPEVAGVFIYAKMTARPLNTPLRVASVRTMDPTRKPALFEQMVIPHLNAAYNLSRWLTRNGQDAEDIVQQAYLKAFRSFETFQGNDVSEARAWLLTIVRNTCYTWLRKKGEEPLTEFDEQVHQAGDRPPDAEAILVNRAKLRSLQGCIEALPAEFRETIVLRELEELSYKEISAIVRVPVGTVMSRLARARTRLQGCMESAK